MDNLDELTLEELMVMRDQVVARIHERIREEMLGLVSGDPPRLPNGEMSKMVAKTGLSPTQLNRIRRGQSSGRKSE